MGRVDYQGHEHPEDQLSLVLTQPHEPWYNAPPSISRSGRATINQNSKSPGIHRVPQSFVLSMRQRPVQRRGNILR